MKITCMDSIITKNTDSNPSTRLYHSVSFTTPVIWARIFCSSPLLYKNTISVLQITSLQHLIHTHTQRTCISNNKLTTAQAFLSVSVPIQIFTCFIQRLALLKYHNHDGPD